jgi:hypothetical protein
MTQIQESPKRTLADLVALLTLGFVVFPAVLYTLGLQASYSYLLEMGFDQHQFPTAFPEMRAQWGVAFSVRPFWIFLGYSIFLYHIIY